MKNFANIASNSSNKAKSCKKNRLKQKIDEVETKVHHGLTDTPLSESDSSSSMFINHILPWNCIHVSIILGFTGTSRGFILMT